MDKFKPRATMTSRSGVCKRLILGHLSRGWKRWFCWGFLPFLQSVPGWQSGDECAREDARDSGTDGVGEDGSRAGGGAADGGGDSEPGFDAGVSGDGCRDGEAE